MDAYFMSLKLYNKYNLKCVFVNLSYAHTMAKFRDGQRCGKVLDAVTIVYAKEEVFST